MAPTPPRTPPGRPLGKRTRAVHAGARRSGWAEMAEAIHLTQGFAYPTAEAAEARFLKAGPDEFIYARYGNPTVAVFEDRISALEGTESAFATASGMAAVSGTLMALLRAGDRVVSSRALFGSCLYVLEEGLRRYGVDVAFVDGTDLRQWQAAVTPGTKLVFLETVSNPTLEVIDLAAVARIAHAAGALVVVDNVFATPVFSRAVELGADLVIYSATKHIDGQGRALGGVICGPRALVRGPIETWMKHTGGAMSPFNAWIMANGLTTMDLRVRAQSAAAMQLAQALSGHPRLARVIYPGLPDHPQHAVAAEQMDGFGTVLAIDLADGKDAAFRLMNALEVVLISNNLGDARTIATHPATTTHQRLPEDQKAALGITPGLIRLSVGLEDPEDLLADLMAALDAA
jgi:O-succinylhomoserine sulfhydrylase